MVRGESANEGAMYINASRRELEQLCELDR
jgi:hypothetical protein